MSGRRQFLLATAALLVAPLADAQKSGRVHRIGYLVPGSLKAGNPFFDAFKSGLREHGYIEGENLAIEVRSAEGKPERLSDLARELVHSNVEIIVTPVNPVTDAAVQATRSIPIVFVVGSDVISRGYAKSLARPGRNLTGLTWDVGAASYSKLLEFLKSCAPRTSRVAILYDPPYPDEIRRAIEEAAAPLELSLFWADIGEDFERSFVAAVRERADAVLSITAARQFARRSELAALAIKYRLPAGYLSAEFVEAGGLLSYGPNIPDLFRNAARYVDKILKGAKPGDLPVERPVKLDLVINLKTAKALGITVPPSILLRADRIIE